jgi:site-specific DNA-methyltransferase (adenine-specific)
MCERIECEIIYTNQSEIELNKFYHMDCMEGMKQYPDKFFDLAIVDPPYGINVANNTTGTVIRNKSDKDRFVTKSWDLEIPNSEYFEELSRVSKNQIVWGGNYFLDILGYCKAPIIWDKLNGDSMYADGEMAWTSKNLPKNLRIFKHQWCGAFKASERKTEKIHPTQKPVALYEWLLNNYAKQGDKILDTHVGSASSLIACYNLGFDYVGFELDEDYYKAACKRIEARKNQMDMFHMEEL